MKALTLTDELKKAAARCLWYKPAEVAITDPIDFTAHVLTYGLHEDVKALRLQLNDDELRDALAQAPSGVFDERSWSYWHFKLGQYPAPPMPMRRFG
jgi:hypothetical protein